MTFSGFLLTIEVGLAGSLGALSRYLISRFVAERISKEFPLGTLLINVSGSFVIGLLFALTARAMISSTLQLILATGFLGGYTTFSTMSWEIIQLVRGGDRAASVLYLGASVVLGLAAAALGLLLGWRI
ncbi:MAG: fluoride efflux transporter CrcB [Ktedonobacteraceae bacterium]|nr:fluoride efflux transporter CrcB [Ktedonobacteraceae bacterium]